MLLHYMKISFKYGGIYIWLIFFIQLFEGILPVLEMILTAEFIDRTLELLQKQGSMAEILPLLFLFGIVIGFTWLIKEVENFITIKLTHRLRERFRPVLVERIAKFPYKIVEEKEVQDHIHRIMKAPEKEIVDGVYLILSFITISIRILGVVFLIGIHVWWCGILLLFMNIPLIYLAKLNGETVYQANQEMSGYMRRYQYLEQLLSGREAMLERNLFGFHGFLQRKWEKVYDKAYHSYIRAFFKYFFAARGYGILSVLFSVVMILLLIHPFMTGKMTSGLFISAASQLLTVVSIMVQQLSEMLKQLSWKRNYMKDLVNFFQLPNEPQTVLDAPQGTFTGFEEVIFDHVSFRYPETEQYALKDVSFRLEAGRHYAFVGENAAGKTTVIKLMTSLYDTYEGNIFVNGKELRDYSPQEKKGLYAVVYQDFAKYYISIQDMIALGIREKCGETVQRRKVQEAIAQVGLTPFVSELINGIDTELGKFEEENVEASNGQWQRLAIARAFVNEAPLCILDEPSASLDPVSEKKLYEEYGKLSKGKTTIFISHRLGSIRLTDKIFVFDKGSVLEQGTFEELIKFDSKFKEMYEAQRSWYE